MENKANKKLYDGHYSSNQEALDLYEQALRFEVVTFPDMASDEEKNELSTMCLINAEYRTAIRNVEKELIERWRGKSQIHDQIVECLEAEDFSGLAF